MNKTLLSNLLSLEQAKFINNFCKIVIDVPHYYKVYQIYSDSKGYFIDCTIFEEDKIKSVKVLNPITTVGNLMRLNYKIKKEVNETSKEVFANTSCITVYKDDRIDKKCMSMFNDLKLIK